MNKLTFYQQMVANLEQAKTIIQTIRGHKENADSQLADLERIITETQAITQKSCYNFQRIIESVNDVVWMATVDGEMLYINSAAEGVYGRPSADFINNPNLRLEVVHPDDKAEVEKGNQQLFEQGIIEQRYRIVRPDGEIRWLRDHKSVVYDLNGKPIQIGGIAADITEQMQVKKALRESEKIHRLTLESISDTVFVTDDQGAFVYVCPNVHIIFGYSSEEVQAFGYITKLLGYCLINPDSTQFTNIEHEITDKFGQKHFLLVNIKRVSIKNGTLLYSCRDITERRQMLDALRASEAKFRSLAENSPNYISIVDRDGIVQFSNRTIPGFSSQQIVGNCLYDYLHGSQQKDIFKQTLDYVFETGKVTSLEYLAGTSYLWYESRIRPIKQNGQMTTAIIHTFDISERKRAEQALQESEERYKRLTEVTREGIAFHDKVGIVDVNPSFVQMFGYEFDELIGKNAIEVLALPESHALIRQNIASRFNQPYEVMARKKDGTVFPIEVQCEKYHHKGKMLRVASVLDITKRKQAEKQLLESKRRLFTLMSNLPGMAYRSSNNKDWTAEFVSEGVFNLTGYQPEVFINNTTISYTDIIAPEDKTPIWEAVQEAVHQQAPFHITYRIRHASGEQRWVLEKGQGIFSATGELEALEGFIIDITELKQAEQALQASEEKYRSLVDNLNVGIFRSSVDDQILSANHALVRILGFDSAEELMQLPAIVRYAVPTQNEKLFTKLREHGEIKDFEVEILRKDSSAVCVSISSILVHDDKGNPLFIDGMLEDITKRKKIEAELAKERASLASKVEERTAELSQANAELARASRLKNEFLANMSHELRTPLNAILTMSELLKDGIYGKINEEQLKAVGHIENGGYHLLSLITDILDLSKIEAGQVRLEPADIIIDGVCRSSMQFVKEIATKKKISVLFASDDNVKTIFADERAVKQILVNLLNNAIKFTPNNGKVTLELHGDEIKRVANISIIDTGIGIPDQELDNLFKPFMQIDSRLNRQHEGTGLGLALVYKLIELHGGSINLKSEVGKGSTFTVSLPWRENNQVPSIREEDEYLRKVKKDIKVRHAGAVVLVAEDNETNIITVRDGLTAYGYKVIVAREGLEAIERAQEIKPAIILMDIQMPGMDGLEATKQIRADADEQLAKTPIIALTALAMPGDKERCLAAGANLYLSKPLNIKQLVEEIETLLS